MKQARIYSLIPTGILRKKYGIFPLSGARDNGSINLTSGSRRDGINYQYLSGMQVDKEGLECAINYALNSQSVDVKVIRKIIDHAISQLSNTDYTNKNAYYAHPIAHVRCILKRLLYSIQHLQLIDKEWDSTHVIIFKKLQEVLEIIKPLALKEGYERKIHDLINKYLTRIIANLTSRLPFVLNDESRDVLAHPFPVIFATKRNISKPIKDVVPISTLLTNEQVVYGELALTEIDFIITDKMHESYCTQLLKEMGLLHIQTLTFPFESFMPQQNLEINDQPPESQNSTEKVIRNPIAYPKTIPSRHMTVGGINDKTIKYLLFNPPLLSIIKNYNYELSKYLILKS